MIYTRSLQPKGAFSQIKFSAVILLTKMSAKMTVDNFMLDKSFTLQDKIEKHLEVSQNQLTAIDLIAENTSLSRQKIKQAMQKGAVWLSSGKKTTRIRRATRQLKKGQTLHLYYDPVILALPPCEPELMADEGDYSVWFKPAGMLSQGTKYGDHCTIYRWAELHLKPQRPAFLVHRLDKATSGLIIVAHSKTAAAKISSLFSGRYMNKFYKALVYGRPSGSLPVILDTPVDGKQAITHILDIQSNADSSLSLLDLQILTGRKHQIRQQLSAAGHAVFGDRLYGTGLTDKRDLCLVAYKLMFRSPFDQQKKVYQLDESCFPGFLIRNGN
jgi:tRNA pseudouridine32 synthase/23S rRNA pseudouridine746 synthase